MKDKQQTTQKHPNHFKKISQDAKRVGKIAAFLTREQMDFIDKIGKDALFSTGKKLSRSTIIQAMIEEFRKLYLSGSDVHSVEELEEKMLEVAKKALPAVSEQLSRQKETA